MTDTSITKKKGKLPGKTVAIFAGVHGNETVGLRAFKKVIKDIQIKSGTVYFVRANPLAISAGKRMVNKNLNRLFFKDNKGKSYEDKRARELMKLLDQCDALLDIHSYNSLTGDQFAICESNANAVVKTMDFPIVASNFSNMGSGTDGYMYQKKKIGICIECGTSNRPKKFQPLAEKSIYQFLQYFRCIDRVVSTDRVKQVKVKASRILYKASNKFRFTKKFKDFEPLKENAVFAIDGNIQHKAKKGECIIFPRPMVKVGGEVCIIGLISKSKS